LPHHPRRLRWDPPRFIMTDFMPNPGCDRLMTNYDLRIITKWSSPTFPLWLT
jgi:hypothetical protein